MRATRPLGAWKGTENMKPTEYTNGALPVSEDWEKVVGYCCVSCSGPAREHPKTNLIWGCLDCRLTTAAVAVFFRPTDSATN